VKSFKLSNDPRFAEKLEDVVHLYLHPPANAIVLSVDEKCQIQALDRTQPRLPWKKGHGTTTLFAAMNTQDGTVIDICMPTHNHVDWIRFLKLIDGRSPKDKALHLIMDNYSAHKTPEVKQWLEENPRFHIHFTPTSSSWLNMVERFFRDVTTKRIRRGVFHSVTELKDAIVDYVKKHNQNPKPYLWTAQARPHTPHAFRRQSSNDAELWLRRPVAETAIAITSSKSRACRDESRHGTQECVRHPNHGCSRLSGGCPRGPARTGGSAPKLLQRFLSVPGRAQAGCPFPEKPYLAAHKARGRRNTGPTCAIL